MPKLRTVPNAAVPSAMIKELKSSLKSFPLLLMSAKCFSVGARLYGQLFTKGMSRITDRQMATTSVKKPKNSFCTGVNFPVSRSVVLLVEACFLLNTNTSRT